MMLKEWLNTTGFEKTREAKKMAKIKKKLMTLEIERSHPSPYSVSEFFGFQENSFPDHLLILTSKKTKNFSTLTPKSLEKNTCPPSWSSTSSEMDMKNCMHSGY